MSNEDDSKPHSEGRFPLFAGILAVVILGAIATGGILYATQDGKNPTFATSAMPESTSVSGASAPGQVDSSSPNTLTIDDGVMGKYHPYTHLFYPSVTPPPGFEGYDCYGVPQDGTAFGTLLLGGANDYLLSDITRGFFFKGGVPIEVDLTKPSAEWENLQLVHVNDYGCSQ